MGQRGLNCACCCGLALSVVNGQPQSVTKAIANQAGFTTPHVFWLFKFINIDRKKVEKGICVSLSQFNSTSNVALLTM